MMFCNSMIGSFDLIERFEWPFCHLKEQEEITRLRTGEGGGQ